MNVPVLYDDSGESSQRIAWATSSGWPPRFIGTAFFTRSTRPGSPPEAWISVLITPGRTEFTRMPSSATYFASPMVSASIAPLEAA